jgi:hypothetical protein
MSADYGVLAQNSNVRISLSNINKQLIAIDSTYSSLVTSQNNTGNTNDVALQAEYYARIRKAGDQPSGTVQEVIENGGIIY